MVFAFTSYQQIIPIFSKDLIIPSQPMNLLSTPATDQTVFLVSAVYGSTI